MTDIPQPPSTEGGPSDDGAGPSGPQWPLVVAGFGAFLIATPFAFIGLLFLDSRLGTGGTILGAIVLALLTIGAGALAYRSHRGLTYGIAAGYLLVSLVSQGICTGWNAGQF